MSVLAWIGVGLGAWTAVSVCAGLALGRLFARATAVERAHRAHARADERLAA